MEKILKDFVGKEVNVSMNNGHTAKGKLLLVDRANPDVSDYFVLETSWANKHYFKLFDLSSVWCTEDKKS